MKRLVTARLITALGIICVMGAVSTGGCGNNKSDKTKDTASPPSSEDTISNESIPPRQQAPVKKTLGASGKTSSGESVALKLNLVNNDVSGTLDMASVKLTVRGILDEGTIRGWLTSKEGTPWRGNMIATLSGDTVEGTFVISDNAGEKTIRGELGTQ